MVAHKRVRPNGGYVRVAGPNPLVRQILEITKLTKLFGGYATVEEAMRAE
jgi:anti-anti-sigma regulatory factor